MVGKPARTRAGRMGEGGRVLKGLRSAGIAGMGIKIPDRVLSNFDLEEMVDTSDAWIRTRTGIRERRLAAEGEATSDLALVAAREAVESAGIVPADLDLIIVATITPDMPFPATACLVQDRLGATKAAAFDLEAACSGFIYGLAVGSQMVQSGLYENVLVIGSEVLSRFTNWDDRGTCVLWGDGAGAAVVRPVPEGYGLLGVHLGSDGGKGDLLKVTAGGSRLPASHETVDQGLHYLFMNGREVFKFAVVIMGEAAEKALAACDMDFGDVDWYVPHQANYRIIEASVRRFGIPMEKVILNVEKYGNTSAASVPLALYEAEAEGKLKRGDVVLAVAFGGGLTWGAAVMRWY